MEPGLPDDLILEDPSSVCRVLLFHVPVDGQKQFRGQDAVQWLARAIRQRDDTLPELPYEQLEEDQRQLEDQVDESCWDRV